MKNRAEGEKWSWLLRKKRYNKKERKKICEPCSQGEGDGEGKGEPKGQNNRRTSTKSINPKHIF